MRTIKFRGKRIDNGEWIPVIPETVGQFTGLVDKNGVEVFEGDLVTGGVRTMLVIFKQAACQFWMVWQDGKINRYEPLSANSGGEIGFSNDGIEVIGNIHDQKQTT